VPKVSARKVVINKTGRLTGAVSANGFVVEKGGYFAGDLAIGEYDKSLDARSLTNLTGAASPEAEGSHATGATESRADM
jgi:cytoskeletal protein CcmA (bactofilin family)